MKRFAAASICAMAIAVGSGVSAAPALADTYTVYLSAPATAVVGQPVVIGVTGVQPPPDQFWALAWIEIVAIPGNVVTACPAAALDGLSVATNTGGRIIDIAMRPSLDAAGNYSNLTGYTPVAPGQWLICAYADDGAGLTLAKASLTLNVQAPSTSTPPPPPGGSGPSASPTGPQAAAAVKPANTRPPRVTRSAGKLSCSAGQWSNGAGGFGYGWTLGGRRVKGATAPKLRVTRAMHGRKVRCAVTASNAAGSATAVSQALRIR